MINVPMELNRVLIVYKASLTRARADRTSKGKRAATSISHHYISVIEGVKKTVEKHAAETVVLDRLKLDRSHKADLIVSVGGDGTFLAASHFAGSTPILGVNFLPSQSVGFFCAAGPNNFIRVFKEILTNKLKAVKLPMLKVMIDRKPLKIMALNEALFASPSPAEMSRYKLKIGRTMEYQRSSGVWIAAGPGSTAAMLSAGGRQQKINNPRLQYLVREPCPPPSTHYRLMHDVLPQGASVNVTSWMPDAYVYIDGPDTAVPIPNKSTLTVKAIPNALKIFI